MSVIHLPRQPTEQQEALLIVASWFRRLDWKMALVAVVAALHLVGSVTLAFAPDNQLFTQGTRPVFDLMSPLVWSAWFLICGIAALSLLIHVTGKRQLLAWSNVVPAQMIWIGASVIAVLRGGGSAMGVVFLGAVFAFTCITAVMVAFDYTSGKR